jgi:hypothetical protein
VTSPEDWEQIAHEQQAGSSTPVRTALPKASPDSPAVDLTTSRKLTAGVPEPPSTFYKVKQYRNGETIFAAYRLGNPDNLTPGRNSQNEQLTDQARSKIKRAARMMQHEFGRCSFCTLTYRRVIPDHDQAKRHLDNFHKRLRRKYPHLEYLWIAENQQRGAIHFHILFNQRIHHSIINKEWNEVIANWTKKQGRKHEKLYPNIQALNKPARYMAKYMSKENGQIGGNYYDMSKGIRQLIQPVKEYYTEIRGPEYEIIKDCERALDKAGIDHLPLVNDDQENMTNASYYADILDQGQKFQFGFFIPAQENQTDLVALLIMAIYPSAKIHNAA